MQNKTKIKKLNIDKDWLYKKYFLEKRSYKEISELIGCTDDPVRQALIKYGYKLRNKNDACKISWERGRHANRKSIKGIKRPPEFGEAVSRALKKLYDSGYVPPPVSEETKRKHSQTMKLTLEKRKQDGIPHWNVGRKRSKKELEFRRQQMLNNNPMNNPILREKARINLIASNAKRPRRTWESMFGVERAKEMREFFREFNKKRNKINNPMNNKESRKKSSETKKKNWKLHPHKSDCKCASCKTIRGEANKFPARSHNVFMGVNFLSKNEYRVAKKRFEILGIVPIQGVNCHMPVNGCSVDFYDLGFFNEFHPMNTRYDGNKTEKEYFYERRKLLDQNGHKKDPLIHLTSTRQAKEMFLFLSKIFKNNLEY